MCVHAIRQLTPTVSDHPRVRLLDDDEDDILAEVPKAVPEEVKEWLASTFTRNSAAAQKRRSDDKVRSKVPCHYSVPAPISHANIRSALSQFRTVANAIRAGIAVDRIYRSICAATLFEIPADIARVLQVSGPKCSSHLMTLDSNVRVWTTGLSMSLL